MGARGARARPDAAAADSEPAAAAKKRRVAGPPCAFLAQWLWKREAKSDKERFDTPYCYPFEPAGEEPSTLVLEQRRFSAEGFASTVWDSAIVLSKFLELRGRGALTGKQCLELGSGCGLLSTVLARLGATVTSTDLECNLPLLRENLRANCDQDVRVEPLMWAAETARAVRGDRVFDLVLASDVMYLEEAVPALVGTLLALCSMDTEVLIAHGRNRPAEKAFLTAVQRAGFSCHEVLVEQLHPVYNCLDVSVLQLRLRSES